MKITTFVSCLFLLALTIALAFLNYDFINDNRLALGGMATDNEANLYSVDAISQYLTKYDSNGYSLGSAADLRDFGVRPLLDKPTGVAVNNEGFIFVSDRSAQNLLGIDARLRATFHLEWNIRFNQPSGLAVDKFDYLYVANTGDANILKIEIKEIDSEHFSSSAVVKASWGKRGTGDGEFISPSVIAVDPRGNVYVGDDTLQRIQKFDSEGNFLTKWGSPGTQEEQFDSISGLAVDTLGNVFVCESKNNRIQKFDSNGKFLTKWESGYGEAAYPEGIAADLNNDLYVLVLGREHSWNERIAKFTNEGKLITSWGGYDHTSFIVFLLISIGLLMLLLRFGYLQLKRNRKLNRDVLIGIVGGPIILVVWLLLGWHIGLVR